MVKYMIFVKKKISKIYEQENKNESFKDLLNTIKIVLNYSNKINYKKNIKENFLIIFDEINQKIANKIQYKNGNLIDKNKDIIYLENIKENLIELNNMCLKIRKNKNIIKLNNKMNTIFLSDDIQPQPYNNNK